MAVDDQAGPGVAGLVGGGDDLGGALLVSCVGAVIVAIGCGHGGRPDHAGRQNGRCCEQVFGQHGGYFTL